ncbi:hypothetical protein GCM10009849_00500 [Sinomonas flava]|uniref:Uncharacterized protein n=1 Tax=Sinomonas flava TaxID=496857 RepID=A0ABN3BH43_9MICC
MSPVAGTGEGLELATGGVGVAPAVGPGMADGIEGAAELSPPWRELGLGPRPPDRKDWTASEPIPRTTMAAAPHVAARGIRRTPRERRAGDLHEAAAMRITAARTKAASGARTTSTKAAAAMAPTNPMNRTLAAAHRAPE